MALYFGFFTFVFVFLFTLTKNLSLVAFNLVKAIVVSAVKLVIVPTFKAFTDAFCTAGKMSGQEATEMVLMETGASYNYDSVKQMSVGEWIFAIIMDPILFVIGVALTVIPAGCVGVFVYNFILGIIEILSTVIIIG